jgi:glutathione peroxidase
MSENQQFIDNFYKVPVLSASGQTVNLEPYQGQVLLVVNVASRCGFTPQYAELETLYREYKTRGFTILGFPCDQFRHQEPGSNQEIKEFAESCYNITFPLFAKIDVKGKEQAPIYTYLAKHIEKKPWIFVPWNFTKILIDPQGRILKRYTPLTSFKTIRNAIEPLLPVQK